MEMRLVILVRIEPVDHDRYEFRHPRHGTPLQVLSTCASAYQGSHCPTSRDLIEGALRRSVTEDLESRMPEIRASGVAEGERGAALPPSIRPGAVVASILGEEDLGGSGSHPADQQRRRERKGEEEDAGRIDVITPLC